MGLSLRRASLLVYFLISLHFLHAATDLASVDQNHDNLPNQPIQSKPNYAGKITESEVVIKKGGGGGGGRGGGGGGRGGGGGGRSFGGGGRSFGGGGRSRGGGGGGRIRPIPIAGGGSYHGGRPSSSDRESPNGLLGLAALAGLVLVF